MLLLGVVAEAVLLILFLHSLVAEWVMLPPVPGHGCRKERERGLGQAEAEGEGNGSRSDTQLARVDDGDGTGRVGTRNVTDISKC